MKLLVGVLVVWLTIVVVYSIPRVIVYTKPAEAVATTTVAVATTTQQQKVYDYLDKKHSPLKSETALILNQKHWQLIIAISAIESQFCNRQLGLNCWGITSMEGGYKHYKNLAEGIVDAERLIERRQKQKRWLTVEQMNCSWVVPCNSNWVNTVNLVQKQLNSL